MNKDEILKKAQQDKDCVGEMERSGINKSNWIALIVTGVLAVALMIIEGALGHYTAIYAIAFVCLAWAAVFYLCQFIFAKRPWPVLLGSILCIIGAAIDLTFYILYATGVL